MARRPCTVLSTLFYGLKSMTLSGHLCLLQVGHETEHRVFCLQQLRLVIMKFS